MKQTDPDPELVFRLLHTLKGGAATFSVKSFADRCHLAESLLTEWKSLKTSELLQQLRELCVELPSLFKEFLQENEVILGNMEKLSERWSEAPVSKLFHFAGQHLPPSPARDVFFREFLFEPAAPLFQHYDEVLQNVAEQQGKQILPIEFKNPDFRLLPEPYETLLGTFIHAFRNAADHGIERPEVREERGKPTAGRLQVEFGLQDEHLQFCIQDDGGGVDPTRIRSKLEQKGISCAGESDDQVIQHIFDSQFSTRDEVTDLSGRGVGMDAIKQAATDLGGKVWVESTLGKGTTLFVQVPWISEPAKKLKAA